MIEAVGRLTATTKVIGELKSSRKTYLLCRGPFGG